MKPVLSLIVAPLVLLTTIEAGMILAGSSADSSIESRDQHRLPDPQQMRSNRSGTKGGHTYSVVIQKAKFVATGRNVVEGDTRPSTRDGYGGPTLVDGKVAWGTDGGLPESEIAEFRIVLDGHDIVVRKKYYADCFNPFFHEGRLFTSVDESGKFVWVKMIGSGGAGLYCVTWRVYGNGSVRRTLERIVL